VNRKGLIVSLGATLLLASGLLLSLNGGDSRAPFTSRSATATPISSVDAILPPVLLPSQTGAEVPGATERRFVTASNYKQVIDRRADNPAQASFFYAARAQKHCALAVSLTADGPNLPLPKSEQSVAARKRLAALCSGVKVGPAFTAITIADEGIDANDAFFSAIGTFEDFLGPLKTQPANVAAVIEMAGRRETPVLASAALEVLSLPHVLKTLSVFGEPAATLPPDKLAALSTAMLLARCDLGADCGPTNFAVDLECAVNGNCLKSMEESLRSDYERQQRGNRPDWNSVLAYRARIVSAVDGQKPWLARR